MKKITALFAGLILALLAFAGPASATGGGGDIPSPDNNKKVELCHATGSESNPYNKITVSINAFYKAGHIDHGSDIWKTFTWTDKWGETHTVYGQGDGDLLAFDDCQKPDEIKKITKPGVMFWDNCGFEDDLFAVVRGEGYTASAPVISGNTQSITVTLDEGYGWHPDASTEDVVYTKPVFTNEPCELPETGGVAQVNSLGGYTALAGILFAGLMFGVAGRRKSRI